MTENLLPIRNGYVLNIVSLEKRKRLKNDFFTYELDSDISKNTKDAESFIKQVCPKDDDDAYTYLTEILGYCLTSWNFMKCFFVFYGQEGDNGKSILLNIMEKIMGQLMTPVATKMFLAMKKDGATPELMQCIGKNLGTYAETSDAYLDDNIIKMITGGDSISIRQLYGTYFSTKLYMKLLLSGNFRPTWKNSPAMVRRVMFFEFGNHFIDGKPTLQHHRKKDEKAVHNFLNNPQYRDQFFTVIVTSASKLFKSRKFTKSEYMDKKKAEYVNDINTSEKFVRMLVPQPKAGFTCGELFDDYQEWCRNENLKCECKGEFVEKLKKAFKPRDKN
jgi:P4 family phage/plasmid primase-like protien